MELEFELVVNGGRVEVDDGRIGLIDLGFNLEEEVGVGRLGGGERVGGDGRKGRLGGLG